MKRKQYVSALMVYFFLMAMLPMSFIADKVNAEGNSNLGVKSYLNYESAYTVFAAQYKDKTVVVKGVKDTPNSLTYKMSVIQGGNEKLVTGTQGCYIDDLIQVKGTYNNNMYMLERGEYGIYSLDLNATKYFLYNSLNLVKLNTNEDYSCYNALVDKNGASWYELESEKDIQSNYQNNYTESLTFYSSNGYQKVVSFDKDQYNSDCDSSFMRLGQDNNVWIIKSNKNYGTLLKIDNNEETEYNFNNDNDGYIVCDMNVDSNGNVYILSSHMAYMSTVQDLKLKHYVISDGKLTYKEQYTEQRNFGIASPYIMDSNGGLWSLRSGVISKFENNKFTPKYKIDSSLTLLNVYDDNHMVAYGEKGYTIISNDEVKAKSTSESSLPSTGSMINIDTLAFAGIAFLGAGSFVLLKKREN